MIYHRRASVGLAAAAVVVGFVACDEAEHATAPRVGPRLSVEEPFPATVRPTVDQEFDRLAREEIPGFGGFYFDQDLNPVVFLTDPERRAEADRWVSGVQQALVAPSREMVVRKADFNFTQLSQWRAQLRQLFTRDGVFSLDIDETENKVRIGVVDSATVEWVDVESAAMGIPANAVFAQVHARPAPRLTLRQWVRPVDGGYQIENESGAVCTMGFNAVRSGENVFVTASHCSRLWYSNPDNSLESQPTDNSSSYAIGREVADLPCAGPSFCRWSDAAVFEYNGGVEFQRGYIARTVNTAYGQDGSVTVNASEPRLKITGTNPYGPYVGWRVDKVGRTSGWTRGTLLQSCVDLQSPAGPDFGCQMVADLWSRPGDSGSPIFKITRRGIPYDNVVLFGVL